MAHHTAMDARPFLALLLLAAAPPHAASPVGHYRLVGVHDAASELVLTCDGRFGYVLAYGALDEEATGRWRRTGKQVLLRTEPKPVPAAFSAGKATKTVEAPLVLHVVAAGGHEMNGIDLRIEFDRGAPLETYIASDEGWRLPTEETRRPVAVTFSIPMYRLVSQRFPIDAATANELTFVLTPHDLGRYDFEDTVLDVLPGKLVMHRDGALLTYQRQR